jgi:ABC-type glycerol-3-phosphate transport system substrate-binding protein
LLGELAERELIVPLREDVINGPDLARRDVFDLVRQCEMVWGDKVYAVPFGSPQLTVFYRRDLFEKLGLEPPNSWAEYQEVGTRLANRAKLGDLVPADVTAWHGILEPLGPGWGGQVLLARAAGYARHRNYFSTLFDTDTMEPLIATAPFARALDELVAAAKLGPPESVTYTPAEVKREFLAGRCGLALTWPSRAASRDERSGKRGQPVALGIAALPGSDQVFHPKERQWRPRDRAESGAVPLLCAAGRLGAVTKSSTQPQAACQLLLRLSGAEWSEQISPHSPATTLYRSSQLRAVSAWFDEGFESAVVQQYADLVKQTQRSPLWLYAVRLPGRERYLAALDGAVQQAVRGEKPSAECLQAAAEQWRKITAELGVQSQAKAYWRSLGIEP